MNPIAKNILAVFGGFFGGSIVNMLLVNLGPMVVPLPEGADVTSMDALRESMKLFTPANFLFPFLGHALGALVGAFIAARLAASHPMKLALGVGGLFFAGGFVMVLTVGGPVWFCVLDLVGAYLPMGYLGGVLAKRNRALLRQ